MMKAGTRKAKSQRMITAKATAAKAKPQSPAPAALHVGCELFIASDGLRREAPSQNLDDDKHDVGREDAERNDRKYPTASHSRLAPA
jgi:hypothetical protein